MTRREAIKTAALGVAVAPAAIATVPVKEEVTCIVTIPEMVNISPVEMWCYKDPPIAMRVLKYVKRGDKFTKVSEDVQVTEGTQWPT